MMNSLHSPSTHATTQTPTRDNTEVATRAAGAWPVATGLVLGPVLFTLGDLVRRLVEPSGTPSAAEITAAVGHHSTAWLTAAFLSILAAFGLVLGAGGLIAARAPGGTGTGGRGSRITAVGATMVAIGALASVGHAVAFYGLYPLYDRAGVSTDAIASLDDASESYPLLIVLIALFIVGLMLGTIVLFVGLRRAHRVPIWSLFAAIVFVACGSTGGVVPGVIGVIAAATAFGPAAWSLMRPGVDTRPELAGR